MSNVTKLLSCVAANKFLQQHPVILIYHSNHIKTRNYRLLKNKLFSLESKIDLLRAEHPVFDSILQLPDQRSSPTLQVEEINVVKKGKVQNKIKILNVKNKIFLNHCLPSFLSKDKKNIAGLLQGTTFLIGCSYKGTQNTSQVTFDKDACWKLNIRDQQVPFIVNQLKKEKNLLLVGGIIDNQIYSHLDLKKWSELQPSVALTLFEALEYSLQSLLSLKKSFDFTFLRNPLITTLEGIYFLHSQKEKK